MSAVCSVVFSSIPENVDFTPLMTGYLTDNTDPEDLRAGISEKVFVGVKMYPANATTNSAHGVTDWRKTERVLAVLEETNTPLLVGGFTVGEHGLTD